MTDCLVINLADQVVRMGFMAAQLKQMGLAFARIEAVKSEDASAAKSKTYWQSWERPLKDAERACLLSHMSAWQRVADAGTPMLILEDDAILSTHIPEVLSAANALNGIDHLTFETRCRRKILARKPTGAVAGHGIFRLYQDRSGAAAYLLWPAGATKLLDNASRSAGLADAVICRAYELFSYQLDPAGAVQIDCASNYGITPPIQTHSAISAAPEATGNRREPGFRMRRIGAQLTMGLRSLCHPFAKRQEISVVPEDFILDRH